MRYRLSDKGYKKICEIVDERDNHACVLCGKPEVQHHHVIYRSAGGSDYIDNLVCLCPHHHWMVHHQRMKYWQSELSNYLASEYAVKFKDDNLDRIHSIYRRYGLTHAMIVKAFLDEKDEHDGESDDK